MSPEPEVLSNYLQNNYTGASYYSTYEAGFFGLWAHYRLCSLSVKNIVVNAAYISGTQKDQLQKEDKRDSCKIARSLREGSATAIYTPPERHVEGEFLAAGHQDPQFGLPAILFVVTEGTHSCPYPFARIPFGNYTNSQITTTVVKTEINCLMIIIYKFYYQVRYTLLIDSRITTQQDYVPFQLLSGYNHQAQIIPGYPQFYRGGILYLLH